MKKLIKLIFVAALSTSLFAMPIHAEETTSSEGFAQNAQGAYVMEYSTQTEVFKKNEAAKLYPASMTKMMSLILVYEAIQKHVISLDDNVTTSAYAASMGGSQVFLEENEVMDVEHLLKSVCIASANDAMVALAEKVAGSEQAFVEKMNQKAKQLKLQQTHFKNATGLHHNEHYSSAKDMALIAKTLLDVGGNDLLKITSTYEDYIREDSDKKFWLVNTNKLIRQYEGVDGLKTGFTSEAGSCISVSAKRNNIRFIVVVMKEPNAKMRNAEVAQLLDYSFTLFDQMSLYPKNKKLDEIKLPDAKSGKVELLSEEDINIIYEKGKDVSIQSQETIWLHKELPYKKGDRLAKVKIELNDGSHVIGYLVSKHDVYKLSFFDILCRGLQNI